MKPVWKKNKIVPLRIMEPRTPEKRKLIVGRRVVEVAVVKGNTMQRIQVPEVLDTKSLRKLLNLSAEQQIQLHDGQESQILSGSKHVKLKNDQELEITEPWTKGTDKNKLSWYLANMEILKDVYPSIKYSEDFTQIIVPEYPLPAFYNCENAPVWLTTPGLTGNISYPKAYNFLISDSVKLANGNIPGHFFEDREGWLYISFHIQSFHPNFSKPSDGSLIAHIYRDLGNFIADKEILRGSS